MKSAGVIGWPVAHSKSPLIHRFWLAKLGLDGDYGRFAVAPDRLGEAIRALPALGLRGVNVTVPHKVAAMAYLDRVDPLAAKVGAVNTVVVEDGALVGYNTDGIGFIEPLDRFYAGDRLRGLALVIGAGGAGRAVAWALADGGYAPLVINRDADRARRLTAEVGGAWWDDVTVYDLQENHVLLLHGEARKVIVNATSLGMSGQPALDVTLDQVDVDTIVYDLVYAPLETPLLAAARARGLRTIDGLAMLIGQAAAAFALFYGAPAPREHDAELRALLTA